MTPQLSVGLPVDWRAGCKTLAYQPWRVKTMEVSCTVQAQKIISAVPMPRPLEKQILADLRDAARKGFQIDLEQLSANLARLTAATA